MSSQFLSSIRKQSAASKDERIAQLESENARLQKEVLRWEEMYGRLRASKEKISSSSSSSSIIPKNSSSTNLATESAEQYQSKADAEIQSLRAMMGAVFEAFPQASHFLAARFGSVPSCIPPSIASPLSSSSNVKYEEPSHGPVGAHAAGNTDLLSNHSNMSANGNRSGNGSGSGSGNGNGGYAFHNSNNSSNSNNSYGNSVPFSPESFQPMQVSKQAHQHYQPQAFVQSHVSAPAPSPSPSPSPSPQQQQQQPVMKQNSPGTIHPLPFVSHDGFSEHASSGPVMSSTARRVSVTTGGSPSPLVQQAAQPRSIARQVSTSQPEDNLSRMIQETVNGIRNLDVQVNEHMAESEAKMQADKAHRQKFVQLQTCLQAMHDIVARAVTSE
eukprot:ANDGO_05591.mRNA.1 hypothetical protein